MLAITWFNKAANTNQFLGISLDFSSGVTLHNYGTVDSTPHKMGLSSVLSM